MGHHSERGVDQLVNDERRVDAGEYFGGPRVIEETEPLASLYIPCPACRAPIAVDLPDEPLPRTLTCPACSAVLVR
jgi:hypothetical protein